MGFKDEGIDWVGNFRPGLDGIDIAQVHPNDRHAVVISRGDLWVVDPVERTASFILPSIDAAIEVQDPNGWLFSKQGIAIVRFGPSGLLWHTKRLSWDGFDQLALVGEELTGLAYNPMGEPWVTFRVDIRTGASTGGSFLAEGTLTSDWEKIADTLGEQN